MPNLSGFVIDSGFARLEEEAKPGGFAYQGLGDCPWHQLTLI